MDTYRLFLAIPIQEAYQPIIWEFINNQQDEYKWAQPEKWHITVLFIGDFPVDRVEALKEALGSHLEHQWALKLNPDKFKFAPKLSNARMIWLNFEEDASFDALVQNTYEKIQELYEMWDLEFNIKLHQKNIPHVTLARFKPFNAYDQAYLQTPNLCKKLDPMSASEVRLFQSELLEGGARYTMLDRYSLAEDYFDE